MKKKVLILHTGGTIGMVFNKGQPKFEPHLPEELSKLAHVTTLVLDKIDSSNVNPTHWVKWLKVLCENYNNYDGFVVAHGTDTMSYTASAFSLALERTTKPIVFTGSQRPLQQIRSDARDNLVNSVEMALAGPPEVSLCFGNKLLRANRSIKFSATDYVAFESFNFQPLVSIGVELDEYWKHFSKEDAVLAGKPQWHLNFNEKVFCFKIFPGIKAKHFEEILKVSDGLVIEGFGSGNIPVLDSAIIKVIQRAQKPIVIVSQCPHGHVNLDLYEGGKLAKKAGAISGGDMTREAAIIKMMLGLGRGFRGRKFNEYFLKPIAGERKI